MVRQSLGGKTVSNPSHTIPELALELADDYEWETTNLSANPFKVSYVSLRTGNLSAHSTLHNINYVELTKTGDLIANYFGGDIFITRFDFKYNNSLGTMTSMISAYYESEINSELRHQGLVDPMTQEYFKGDIYDTSTEGNLALAHYCDGYWPEENNFYYRPEFFGYNDDYTKHSSLPVFPLPFNYEWCSDCGNQYPYRIIASEQSFQTEVSDNYRNFKANNFRDLNGDCGGLEHLVVDNDNLFALTYNYPVFIPTKPQSIQTNEDVAYVGTGDPLSIPFKKLSTTTYPHGGCRDWMGVVTTEYGTFYPDSEHGKIHRLANPPALVTEGMTNWFENNLPFGIHEQFYRLLGYRYPWTYPTDGVGICATYDPRHKRYIITKNDFVLDETTFAGEKDFLDTTTIANKVYWDPILKFFFQKKNSTSNEKINFGKSTAIQNRS
jgi:hypothetical protein